MSLKESIVEAAALEWFGAQRCEFKEAANNFSSTLATLRDTRYVPPQRVAQDVTERQQRVLAMLSESGAGLARDWRSGKCMRGLARESPNDKRAKTWKHCESLVWLKRRGTVAAHDGACHEGV